MLLKPARSAVDYFTDAFSFIGFAVQLDESDQSLHDLYLIAGMGPLQLPASYPDVVLAVFRFLGRVPRLWSHDRCPARAKALLLAAPLAWECLTDVLLARHHHELSLPEMSESGSRQGN